MAERSPEFTAEAAHYNMDLLAGNSYPGRGLVLGQSADGQSLVQVYWITGRSDPSKNRTILEKDGEIWTEPYDKSKVIDPLTVYQLMGQAGVWHVVSNGAQTADVVQAMGRTGEESGFRRALDKHTYEPDSLATPRITGMSSAQSGTVEHRFSIIRRGDDGKPIRDSYSTCDWNSANGRSYGLGRAIQTYEHNGDPVPSFEGGPYTLPLGNGAEDSAGLYWDTLDPTKKVSLVAKQINKATGDITLSIKNAIES